MLVEVLFLDVLLVYSNYLKQEQIGPLYTCSEKQVKTIPICKLDVFTYQDVVTTYIMKEHTHTHTHPNHVIQNIM